MTSQRLTTLVEDVEFDATELANRYDNECQWLVALSDWQISVILSSLRFAEWRSRWRNLGAITWDKIESQISELEYCLMSGCNVGELIDKFDTLNGYMLTLVSRFVTPEGENIAEVTEGQILSAVCSPDVNIDVSCGSSGCSGSMLGSMLNGSITDSDPLPDLGDPETDPPPDGFVSWESYRVYKCKAANFIVEGTERVFRIIGGTNAEVAAAGIAGAGAFITEVLITSGGMAVTAMAMPSGSVMLIAGGVLLSLPAWAIGAIVAAIVAVIALNIGILILFINAADAFHSSAEQTACALYNANTVIEAKGVLSTAWGDAILVFDIDPPYNAYEAAIRSMMSAVVGYLITNSLINMLFSPSEIVEKYTDPPYDCSLCSTPGSFDFTIDEQGWILDTGVSQYNEQYVAGSYFDATNSGVTDSILLIYYPELASITSLKTFVEGQGGQLTSVRVVTSDSVEGPWTTADYEEYVSTVGFTEVEFTGLSITDKYIGIKLTRFNGWSRIRSVEFI